MVYFNCSFLNEGQNSKTRFITSFLSITRLQGSCVTVSAVSTNQQQCCLQSPLWEATVITDVVAQFYTW